ncbi:MAG: hypothetical protein RR295_05210, partial [Oscillospiraceae bacterium]
IFRGSKKKSSAIAVTLLFFFRASAHRAGLAQSAFSSADGGDKQAKLWQGDSRALWGIVLAYPHRGGITSLFLCVILCYTLFRK